MLALQLAPEVHSIAYSTLDLVGPTGEFAPDLFVKLDVLEFSEGTLAGIGDSLAEVQASISSVAAVSNMGTVLPIQSPRKVSFNYGLGVEVHMSQSGLATPNARVAATAELLAEPIVQHIWDIMEEKRMKHGAFPVCPDEFYPEYRAIDHEQPWLKATLAKLSEPKLLGSWRGRFMRNESLWRGHVKGDQREAELVVENSLLEFGFTRGGHYSRSGRTLSLGDIEVSTISSSRGNEFFDALGEAPPGSSTVFLRYAQYLPPTAYAKIMQGTLTRTTPPDLLVACSDGWSKEQRKLGLSLLEAHTIGQPRDLLARAGMREQVGNMDGALEDLRRAYWYGKFTPDSEPLVDQAESAAKRMGLESATEMPSEDWLVSEGYQEIRLDTDPVVIEVTTEDIQRFYFKNDSGICLIAAGLGTDSEGRPTAFTGIYGATWSSRCFSHNQATHSDGRRGIWFNHSFMDDAEGETVRVSLSVHSKMKWD